MCYFDCQSFWFYGVSNLECLHDCFENNTVTNGQQSEHCVNALISDELTNGICSEITENLLRGEDCLRDIWEQQYFILRIVLIYDC